MTRGFLCILLRFFTLGIQRAKVTIVYTWCQEVVNFDQTIFSRTILGNYFYERKTTNELIDQPFLFVPCLTTPYLTTTGNKK